MNNDNDDVSILIFSGDTLHRKTVKRRDLWGMSPFDYYETSEDNPVLVAQAIIKECVDLMKGHDWGDYWVIRRLEVALSLLKKATQ